MNLDLSYIFLLILIIPIDNIGAAHTSYQYQNKRIHKKINIENSLGIKNDVFAYETEKIADEQSIAEAAKLEVDILKCPKGCICQYARFEDLPIFRWIGHLQNRIPEKLKETPNIEDELENYNENDSESVNDNEEDFPVNPFIKQATCILEEDANEIDLVNSLPLDLQALILLYTGIGRNKTVKTSALKALNQLTTLEIRGTQDRTLRLVFDEPLSFIQHANFESISLMGSDALKRPKNPVDPRDQFDYKPKGEHFTMNYETVNELNANKTFYEIQRLGFEAPIEEIEILPYDIYMEEMKKARMPSFYGWDNLEVLRIHSCQLKELYWEIFYGLGSLQHLSLERNSIAVIPAFALSGALHIKTLSLAHNQIHDLHYRALAGLLELEMLDLCDNRLSKLSEMSFPPFPKLKHVDFSKNPLRYIFPATFWVMNGTHKMVFDSRHAALELRLNEPFESLRQLQELIIANTTINTLEQNIFKGLVSLQILKLRGTIHKIDFDSFAGLVELQELILSHCGISEISMDALIGVRKLQVLDLSHNNLSYIPPGLFDDQAGLTEIYLQNNQLQTLPYTFFLQPKLRLAHLNENPWKCSCSMVNWRSKITNQKRASRAERCITDFTTGKKFACRQYKEFSFDKNLTPRCDNYNGRSVFYVMRKQLQCGEGKLIYRQTKQLKHKETHHIKRNGRRNQKDANDNKIPENELKNAQITSKKTTLNYVSKYDRTNTESKILKSTKDISNEI